MQQMFHAHNIKRTILKQKHNTANSYHNNNLSISPDSSKSQQESNYKPAIKLYFKLH